MSISFIVNSAFNKFICRVPSVLLKAELTVFEISCVIFMIQCQNEKNAKKDFFDEFFIFKKFSFYNT